MNIESIVRGLELEDKNREEERARINSKAEAETATEAAYRKIFYDIKNSDYDEKVITDYLSKEQRALTIGALFWAIENKEMDIKSQEARKTWKSILDFFDSRKEELESDKKFIKMELYKRSSPIKYYFQESLSGFLGLFVMGVTAGIFSWDMIHDPIIHRLCSKNLRNYIG
jgi:hypothetical protein